ncbi:MAG: hypothetical protein QGI81_06185 [Pseudomonadales bacterium]|nr:hypothetical protein [Pseudomonadales bacterium]
MSFGLSYNFSQYVLALLATWFAATDGGGGDNGSSSGPVQQPPPPQTFTASGSIGDGPVVGADVVATDAQNRTVVSGESDVLANYSIDIPSGTPLPVLITSTGGTDLVTNRAPEFTMVGVVHAEGAQTVNVSPLSTLIVRTAECNDGLSSNKFDAAMDTVLSSMSMGLDETVIEHPMTDPVSASNIATIVLSNEALGEAVRRSHAALIRGGAALPMDDVLSIVGCALAGRPPSGADASTYAVFRTAQAQVLLEVLAGRLSVDGSDATERMDSSIRTVLPSATSVSVTDVPVNQALIDQTSRALLLLQGVVDEHALATFAILLDRATVMNARRLVDEHLTVTARALADVVDSVALAEQSVVADIVARDGDQEDAMPPSIELSASQSRVKSGMSVTLSWSSMNTERCWSEGDWDGTRPAEGSFVVAAAEKHSTFWLKCTGLGGAVAQKVHVEVEEPDPLPRVTLTATPDDIIIGERTRIAWQASNASECRAAGAWSGARNPSGSMQSSKLVEAGTVTFELTCSGSGGSVTEEVHVRVSKPDVQKPVLTFGASKTKVLVGKGVRLSWTSQHTQACAAEGGWKGRRVTSGSQWIGNIQENTTFALRCTGPGGEVLRSVFITAVADGSGGGDDGGGGGNHVPDPTVTFSVSKKTVSAGGAVTLSWQTQNAAACQTSGGWAGGIGTSGTRIVKGIDEKTTFSISCSRNEKHVIKMVTVSVRSDVVLKWQAPTKNTNGTRLKDLAGYRIHYGKKVGKFTFSVKVNDQTATEWLLPLVSGTWHVAMTAYDSNGDESERSNIVTKVAP